MNHKGAKTNEHIRNIIQTSVLSVSNLASLLRLSKTTVQKWKTAGRVTNLSSTPHHIEYSLSKLEERLLVKVRRHLRLSAFDCVRVCLPYIPHLKEVTVHRVFERYGVSKIPQPFRHVGKFPSYLPGFFHIDLAYLPHLEKGSARRYVLIAIDRTTKLLFIKVVIGKTQKQTIQFLRELQKWCPYKIHHLLTDNGREFVGDFNRIAFSLGIKHMYTKIKHPWTNGQAEITVKLLKANTTWKNHYSNYNELINSLQNFVNEYNYTRKLRRLGNKTPVEITNEWRLKKEPIFYKYITPTNLLIHTTTL